MRRSPAIAAFMCIMYGMGRERTSEVARPEAAMIPELRAFDQELRFLMQPD